VRYGTAEAHGRAEMMEFNYLVEQKAIGRSDNKYSVDFASIPTAIARLSKELLDIEATGSRSRAEAWFNRYDRMPQQLAQALQSAQDVPVDIEPVFSFPVMQ
jgi:hypothetical protein